MQNRREKTQAAKEKDSEEAENICLLAEAGLTLIMWSPTTPLSARGINEDTEEGL